MGSWWAEESWLKKSLEGQGPSARICVGARSPGRGWRGVQSLQATEQTQELEGVESRAGMGQVVVKSKAWVCGGRGGPLGI